MTDQTSKPDYEYDVALSFAGEDRNYVEQIAQLLRSRHIRVFYDEYMVADMWGNDLYVLLDEIYRQKSRFTIIFVSKNYAQKIWTSHERQSAQTRALNEADAYILPVRLDDSEIPGLRPTVAYIDARTTSAERLVNLIEQKLGKPSTGPSKLISGVPRSLGDKARLLVERPEAWEYLLFASSIYLAKEALSPKIRDYELGYAQRIGPTFSSADEAMSFVQNEFGDAIATNENTMKLISPASQEWVFGRSGEPGDPGRIEHLGRRLVGSYESYLDRVARLRGAAVPDGFEHLFQLAAKLNERPTNEIGEFLDTVVSETDKIPALLLRDEPITVSLRLKLTADDRLVRQYAKEQNRVLRHFGI